MRIRVLAVATATLCLAVASSCSTTSPQDVLDGACAKVAEQVAALPPVQTGDEYGQIGTKLATEYTFAADALHTMQGLALGPDQKDALEFVRTWSTVVGRLGNERDLFSGKGLSNLPGSDTSNSMRAVQRVKDTATATQEAATAGRAAGLAHCGQPVPWQPQLS